MGAWIERLLIEWESLVDELAKLFEVSVLFQFLVIGGLFMLLILGAIVVYR